MTTPISTPLEESEINELRAFLVKQKEQQEGMSIEEAHGFITGIIAGPEVVHPSLWVATILNGPADFESADHEQRIIGNLCRLYNDTVSHLHAEAVFPEHYYPAHPVHSETGVNYEAVQDWCSAFMLAIEEDKWEGIDDFQMILFPIRISSVSDDETPLKDFCERQKLPAEEVRGHFLQYITPSVRELYSYLAQVKHHADIDMLQEDDDEGEEHKECHEGCETVH